MVPVGGKGWRREMAGGMERMGVEWMVLKGRGWYRDWLLSNSLGVKRYEPVIADITWHSLCGRPVWSMIYMPFFI